MKLEIKQNCLKPKA